MGQFATGVVVISTGSGDDVHAMTANAFLSASLEPPLLLVSVAGKARMHARLMKAHDFGISILMNDQVFVSNHFAGKPTPGKTPCFEHFNEVPVIENAAVQVACQSRYRYPCGDHTLIVGEAVGLRLHTKPVPLVFHGGAYAELVQQGA